MVYSLNEAYKNNQIFYWCNSTGDINVPGAAPMHCGNVEDLPEKQREIYEKYWNDNAGALVYVVTYRGRPGIVLGYLIDYSWLHDMLGISGRDDVPAEKKAIFQQAAEEAANNLADYLANAEGGKYAEAEVIYGDGTDPDGHEILVFLPYGIAEMATELAGDIEAEGLVYDRIEKAVVGVGENGERKRNDLSALFADVAKRSAEVNAAADLIREAASLGLLTMPDNDHVMVVVSDEKAGHYEQFNLLDAAIDLINSGNVDALKDAIKGAKEHPSSYSVAISGDLGVGERRIDLVRPISQVTKWTLTEVHVKIAKSLVECHGTSRIPRAKPNENTGIVSEGTA